MKKPKQQYPKVSLMAVITPSGVSVEPLLMFPDAQTSADFRQWGKTSMHPAQAQGNNSISPAEAHHQAYVQKAIQSLAPNSGRQEAMIAQKENLQGISREQGRTQGLQSQNPASIPEQDQERERHNER